MKAAELKAAVEKFSGLHSEDKLEAGAVKEAIAADEKNYSPEDVEKIYNKIVETDAPPADKYTAVSEFRDYDDFNKVIEVGDDISHFDSARLARLEELGLAKKGK